MILKPGLFLRWFEPHPAWWDIALGLGCGAASTVLRLLLFSPTSGLSYAFSTHFFGITLAAILGGYRGGVVAWVTIVLVTWWLFVPSQGSFALHSTADAVALGLFAAATGLEAAVAAYLRRTIIRLSATEKHLRLVANELNHRVKNSLAMVQSVAKHTARHSADIAEFDKVLQARLKAMAQANDVLIRENWRDVDIRSLIEAELGIWGTRVALQDRGLIVPARTALGLSMIVHELATNAAKYGALSGTGRVEISCSRDRTGGLLEWRETGGPRVVPPSRRGFGSQLITRIASAQLGGEPVVEFRPEGLYARFAFSLA
jgi:two-component sensor histidine kinase